MISILVDEPGDDVLVHIGQWSDVRFEPLTETYKIYGKVDPTSDVRHFLSKIAFGRKYRRRWHIVYRHGYKESDGSFRNIHVGGVKAFEGYLTILEAPTDGRGSWVFRIDSSKPLKVD